MSPNRDGLSLRKISSLSEFLLRTYLENAPHLIELEQALAHPNSPGESIKKTLTGWEGSVGALVLGQLFHKKNRPILWVLRDQESAAYAYNDLQLSLGPDQVLYYPGSYRKPYQIEDTANANVLLRTEVLKKLKTTKYPVVVTYTAALLEQVVGEKSMTEQTLKLSVGDKVSLDFINETLFEYHFQRVDFVAEPGTFSVRGGIIDVFSYAHEDPYRIEFFGDEIESIRTFDLQTQWSKNQVNSMEIMGDIDDKSLDIPRVSFLKHWPAHTLLITENQDLIARDLSDLYRQAEQVYTSHLGRGVAQLPPHTLLISGEELIKEWSTLDQIDVVGQVSDKKPDFVWSTKPQPAFHKKFDLLVADLHQKQRDGLHTVIACATEQQAHRMRDIWAQIDPEATFTAEVMTLSQGFISPELNLVLYTDHQIFERYHKFKLKSHNTKKAAEALNALNKWEIGDYVTHMDHGIGKYAGLQRIEVEGRMQEAIKLIYGDRDILYVSIHALHKISKYNGKEGAEPKLYKLGSPAWKAVKEKTKARVKKIAFDLIQTYAKRKLKKGFQYGPDSYLQYELEASFLYEDTPDQSKATADVKQDMESERPMDRLICGDVGFGKTEVAIRAAFKAADNGKQVAVLVPTTILAYQHYKSFSQRMADLPIEIEYLNRFRSAKEKKDILERLERGQIDVLIGTHLIVGPQIKYKDLGLLIVDEEQKFGVSVKDKLKSLKENIDVLTLTATPIPRTLQFSLMAARDLSVIQTPPPNRYPIESELIRFDEGKIRDAVAYEISRGGQVFFIHNRIENIKEVAGMIQRLVPDARITIAHGQMEGHQLEEQMIAFMQGDYDVLVSTSIIESGLDVSNANTMLINNAQNFGLSDLHQMRGRVGRSNKKAFCYFITPPEIAMTEVARKRLEALTQFTALGSGFHIAMKDLEIRGAGDLLGGEQSGFINDIGFDTYQKIMQEAIEELKENSFAELFKDEPKTKKNWGISEIQIDTDLELRFTEDYINSTTERLAMYAELAAIENLADLNTFESQLIDRFGAMPGVAKSLLQSVALKIRVMPLGIEKIVLKQGKMWCYFVGDPQSPFYQSDQFHSLLNLVAARPGICVFKEKDTRNGKRLMIVFDSIKSAAKAYQAIDQLLATAP